MENHLTTLDSTFFLKLMPENQGHSGRLTVYVQTPWPQDVFTNQIGIPRMYARGHDFSRSDGSGKGAWRSMTLNA